MPSDHLSAEDPPAKTPIESAETAPSLESVDALLELIEPGKGQGHLSAEDLAWIRSRTEHPLPPGSSISASLGLAVTDRATLLAEVDRLLAKIKEQGDVLDRVGARWCMCSRADRMDDRAQPHCPYHGEPRHWQQRAEQAEAEVERLRAAIARVDALVAGWKEIGDRRNTDHLHGSDVAGWIRAALAGDDNGGDQP